MPLSGGNGELCPPINISTQLIIHGRSSLTLSERRKYTDAVLCLMSKPPRLAPDEAPGARSRFDDFVAVHINQTIGIHATVSQISVDRYASEPPLRTTGNRATSSPGTATSPGPTSKPFATNAATTATSPTGHGRNTQTTRSTPRSSTDPTTASPATASTSHTTTRPSQNTRTSPPGRAADA